MQRLFEWHILVFLFYFLMIFNNIIDFPVMNVFCKRAAASIIIHNMIT